MSKGPREGVPTPVRSGIRVCIPSGRDYETVCLIRSLGALERIFPVCFLYGQNPFSEVEPDVSSLENPLEALDDLLATIRDGKYSIILLDLESESLRLKPFADFFGGELRERGREEFSTADVLWEVFLFFDEPGRDVTTTSPRDRHLASDPSISIKETDIFAWDSLF